MEVQLNIAYPQLLEIIRQMPIASWNRLKSDVEKINIIKEKQKKIKERPFGILKGKIWMADDFNAPLDDFREYM